MEKRTAPVSCRRPLCTRAERSTTGKRRATEAMMCREEHSACELLSPSVCKS